MPNWLKAIPFLSNLGPTRPVRGIRLAMLLPLVVLQTGCFTPKAIDRWQRSAPLESARLEVIEARSDSVRLRWKATYRGVPSRSGKLKLNPQLPDCNDVRVLIRDGDALLEPPRQGEDEPAAQVAPSEGSPSGDCDVIIVVARTSEDVALRASNKMRALGDAEIAAPHNHLWLAVIPMAAVGDAALAVAVMPFGVLWALGQSEEPTTWTWTP